MVNFILFGSGLKVKQKKVVKNGKTRCESLQQRHYSDLRDL